MYRIEIYLEKSAGAAGDLGAAANRFSEHMRGTGKANLRTYAGHNIRAELDKLHSRGAANPNFVPPPPARFQRHFGEDRVTEFNPKNRAQALGAGLSGAADRVIGAPRKMLNNANFGRNPFSGL